MRKLWFGIDNQFSVDVEDDATDADIDYAIWCRLSEVLRDYTVDDFEITIEEE